MPDETALREKAREVVRQGKLPTRPPDRVWGGPGVDAPCAVCELPVGKNEMEFEVEFARDGHGGGGDLDSSTCTVAASPPGSSNGSKHR